MPKGSFVHSASQVEQLESDARALLGIPRLPDGANGPMGRALLAQIQADAAKLGTAAALVIHARYATVAHAIALNTDPPEHRAASGRTAADLRHPTNPSSYYYPLSDELSHALANPVARARCSAQALQRLDAHKAQSVDLPADWTPGSGKP